MKLAALALVLTASLPSLALAAPAASTAQKLTVHAPTEPTTYLQIGAMIGGENAGDYWAGTLDAGLRLGHTPLWAHGQIAIGDAVNRDGQYGGGTDEGVYRSLRGGLELRGAVPGTHGWLGGYAGVDVGYHSLDVTEANMSVHASSAVVVLRGGLDLGGEHVRVRPGFEVTPLASAGGEGFVVNTAVAYQW